MSYEKTTWVTGDVITAEKLNNIESGIESAGSGVSIELVSIELAHSLTEVISCSHTCDQVRGLFASGTPIILKIRAASGPYDGMPINIWYVTSCDGQINTDESPQNGPVFAYNDSGQSHSIAFTSTGVQLL